MVQSSSGLGGAFCEKLEVFLKWNFLNKYVAVISFAFSSCLSLSDGDRYYRNLNTNYKIIVWDITAPFNLVSSSNYSNAKMGAKYTCL